MKKYYINRDLVHFRKGEEIEETHYLFDFLNLLMVLTQVTYEPEIDEYGNCKNCGHDLSD